ncbi:MAG: hypothetical protein ACOVO1_09605 [Chitinophagaceae bacterium]
MKKLIVATLSVVLFFACKKEENPSNGDLTLSTANIAGKYRTTDAYVTLKSSLIGASIYDTAFNSVCKKYSYHTFDTAGNYVFFDSCKSSSTTSSYSITPPTMLTYGGKQYLVNSLTSTKLVVSFDSIIPVFGDATFKLTFTRQ